MVKAENRQTLWNERYQRGETADKPPEPVLVRAVRGQRLGRAGRALDLACGLGRNSIYLAELGWEVIAVDFSEIALAKLGERSSEIQIIQADLERGEFEIEPNGYDLIVDCCFLHRPLFPSIREGIRPSGLFVGVLPLPDESAQKSINPAFLIESGELLSYFSDWKIEHWSEGRSEGDPARRLRAELIARKPG
jgi:tellurite methyltransferase